MKKIGYLFKRIQSKHIKWAVFFLIVISFPFILQWILLNGIYISDSFDNETWFSFMGSYMGLLITIFVFRVTIKSNRKIAELSDEIKKVENLVCFYRLNLLTPIFDPLIFPMDISRIVLELASKQLELECHKYCIKGNEKEDILFKHLEVINKEINEIMKMANISKIEYNREEQIKIAYEMHNKLLHLSFDNKQKLDNLYNGYFIEKRNEQYSIF